VTATGPGADGEDPRIGRARASVGIASMALQQIEDDLADLADPETLAEILRELFREDDPQAGLCGSLAQLLDVTGRAADRIEDQDHEADREVSGLLEEAAAFVIDSAGLRLHYATRTLHPAGERE
jgi:hypothetical protein